jgi:16S rRNA (uracil1498-N3)-methyltransferase
MALVTPRLPRLFVVRDLDASSLALDERESHYLGHVLRLTRGDALIAFNGRGAERHATVNSLQRRGAILDLQAEHSPLPESSLDLTLVQALAKSDAMDLIVQKATELGARAIVPVYTEFSVVRLDAERGLRRLEHWRRITESACEQCGRHRPPAIGPPELLAAALEGLSGDGARYALQPSADRSFDKEEAPVGPLVVAVGPEGGFGAMDWRRLESARFARVALGRRVLRAETAAIAVCAIAQSRWGDL